MGVGLQLAARCLVRIMRLCITQKIIINNQMNQVLEQTRYYGPMLF